jgi:hypothetical protein
MQAPLVSRKAPLMIDGLLPCQAMFGMTRGAQIERAIVEDTGSPCPCRQGRVCPLVGLFLPEFEPPAVAV